MYSYPIRPEDLKIMYECLRDIGWNYDDRAGQIIYKYAEYFERGDNT